MVRFTSDIRSRRLAHLHRPVAVFHQKSWCVSALPPQLRETPGRTWENARWKPTENAACSSPPNDWLSQFIEIMYWLVPCHVTPSCLGSIDKIVSPLGIWSLSLSSYLCHSMHGDAAAKWAKLQKNHGLEKNFDFILNDSHFLSCFRGCAVGLSVLWRRHTQNHRGKIASGASCFTWNPFQPSKALPVESQKLTMNW